MKKSYDHYKVICISLYNADHTRLDEMVALLKARGQHGASRSSLIRYALREVWEAVEQDKVGLSR